MGIAERWKGFRELPPNIQKAVECLVPLLEREGVLLAYLFGSLQRGGPGQDVDLAILVEGRPAYGLRDMITEALGTERVDLVDLGRASPVLRFEILCTGRPFYVAGPGIQERFELATLHLYRDTHFLRRRQRAYLRERMS